MPVKREILERHRHYFKAVLSIDIDVGLVNLWFMHLKIQSRGESFGAELRRALQSRRQFLSDIGIIGPDDVVTNKHLDELEKLDLSAAADDLAKSLGKSFKPLPERGSVKGVYAEMIDRPSGKYALIERSKEFSLVPWREVMEKRRGMEISGNVSRGRINWKMGREQVIKLANSDKYMH